MQPARVARPGSSPRSERAIGPACCRAVDEMSGEEPRHRRVADGGAGLAHVWIHCGYTLLFGLIQSCPKSLISLGSPSRARTYDLRINSPSLYRLSYRGSDLTKAAEDLQVAVSEKGRSVMAPPMTGQCVLQISQACEGFSATGRVCRASCRSRGAEHFVQSFSEDERARRRSRHGFPVSMPIHCSTHAIMSTICTSSDTRRFRTSSGLRFRTSSGRRGSAPERRGLFLAF